MNTCKKSKAAEEYLTAHPDFLPELETSCPKNFARYDYLSEKCQAVGLDTEIIGSLIRHSV